MKFLLGKVFVLLTRQCVFCVVRFKQFNVMFEELHQKQSQWTVPDSELRESLRLAVAEVLLPAYRSFVKRFGCVLVLIHFKYYHITIYY
jgi:hypothetical protein